MGALEVRVQTGRLRGANHDGFRLFQGIPYAAPPVGDLRFTSPKPPKPWTGVRDAISPAEPALQPNMDISYNEVHFDRGRVVGSEDCLYLNVYVPQEPGPHAVLVWIHGGGGFAGSANDINGKSFAHNGVVMVTVGYRLGALGLLHLPEVFDDEAKCNFALLDQIAALRWVHDNIAAFGGDPERVTVAGISNGGRSVGNILAAPSAAGLYRHAIVQSATGVGYITAQPDQAKRLANALLVELGLDFPSASRLRDLPAAAIVSAQTRVAAACRTLLAFQAVTDGEIIPQVPIEAIRNAVARDIPLLVGSTYNEADVFFTELTNKGTAAELSMVVDIKRFERARSAYRRLLPPYWSDDEVTSHTLTSSEWWIPAIRLAEAQAKAGGRVWMYRLDWRLRPRGEGLGAVHGLDAPFILNDIDNPRFAGLLSNSDSDRPAKCLLADEMHRAWVLFVTTGAPGSNTDWPCYDFDSRATFLFDDSSTLAYDPEERLRVVWDDLI